MKRLNESNIEQVLIASIQGLREMHSVFGADIFSEKDKMFIGEIKEKGASKTITDLVENLLNELEGRRCVPLFHCLKYKSNLDLYLSKLSNELIPFSVFIIKRF